MNVAAGGSATGSGGTDRVAEATTGDAVTDGVNGTPLLSSESRMVNIATNFGIVY
jgi:hypothetical protein